MRLNIIWSVLRSLAPTKQPPQTQASTVRAEKQLPSDGDSLGWFMYWNRRGQPWRRKPEISEERKEELAKLYVIKGDSIVDLLVEDPPPLENISLTCADVEWLIEISKLEFRLNSYEARWEAA